MSDPAFILLGAAVSLLVFVLVSLVRAVWPRHHVRCSICGRDWSVCRHEGGDRYTW